MDFRSIAGLQACSTSHVQVTFLQGDFNALDNDAISVLQQATVAYYASYSHLAVSARVVELNTTLVTSPLFPFASRFLAGLAHYDMDSGEAVCKFLR